MVSNARQRMTKFAVRRRKTGEALSLGLLATFPLMVSLFLCQVAARAP